jgi:threonine dehydrogenase-like Zn-dependent dehydrogenase
VDPALDAAARPLRELEQAATMLAASPEVTAALITYRFGINEAPRAFAVAAARPPGTFKVVIHP